MEKVNFKSDEMNIDSISKVVISLSKRLEKIYVTQPIADELNRCDCLRKNIFILKDIEQHFFENVDMTSFFADEKKFQLILCEDQNLYELLGFLEPLIEEKGVLLSLELCDTSKKVYRWRDGTEAKGELDFSKYSMGGAYILLRR